MIQPDDQTRDCEKCKEREAEEGYGLSLCRECRTELSKHGVPIWIKGSAVAIMILLLYSLFQFPSTLKAGIHYERGVQALDNRMSWTAVREFEQAKDRFPDSTKIHARLFIAYYQSGQFGSAAQALHTLGGRSAESESMADRINRLASELERRYYLDDELQAISRESDLDLRIAKLRDYLGKHPESVTGSYSLADSLFDAKQFDEVESILLALRVEEPNFDSADLLLAAAYRETGLFDKAAEIVQAVLRHNPESDSAYFALSRIELKQHLDEQGLQDARTAYDLNSDHGSTIANLALAYHYNQNPAERDRLVALLRDRDDYGQAQLDELMSIFDGTTAWRD